MAQPKYQVFISSTYQDLKEERKALTWAMLSARHIPAGMENFTPTDDRGWKTILSIIDKSDYYVLVLAGNYGSIDEDGLSWTEKEYDYAYRKKVPVLAFIRNAASISSNHSDTDPQIIAKKKAFHQKVMTRHLVGRWDQKEDLVGLVTNALAIHISDDERKGEGRPGWFRGDDFFASGNFLGLEDDLRKAVTGTWEGKYEQIFKGKKIAVDLTMKLKANHNGSIVGYATVPFGENSFKVNIKGGVYSRQFLKMEYENANKAVIQFGSFVFKLSHNIKTISGHFVGYGHITQKVIGGPAELTKVSNKTT
jgi:hypothetical protein